MDNGSNGKNGDPAPQTRVDSQNPETVRMWMSAYLDGELDNAQEAALMKAIDENAALATEFEHMCAAFCAPDGSSLLSTEAPALSPHLQAQLQDSILAATVPQALAATSASAERLTSQLVDAELSKAGASRLETLLQDAPSASAALSFAHATEAAQATLTAAATHPDIEEDLAFSAGAVMDTVAADERAGVTWMAYADAEGSAEDLERMLSTSDADRLSAVALQPDAMDGIAAVLRSVADHPAAAKAGAAALQAISATTALEAEKETVTAPAAPVQAEGSYFDRIRGIFANLAAPLVFASGAAALFVGIGGVGETAPPVSPTKTPPIPYAVDPANLVKAPVSSNPVKLAWVQGEMFTTLAGEILNEETALREFDDLDILDDNSETEVQTIESGAAAPMVFSTAASRITVIWVPDAGTPDEDLDGTGSDRSDDEKTEMGT